MILKGHDGIITSLAMVPDGTALISASTDRTLRIWDPVRGKIMRIIEGHDDWIWSVAISEDAKSFVSASRDRTVRMWSIDTGKLIATYVAASPVKIVTSTRRDGRLACGTSDGQVHFLKIVNSQ